ncbi:MAG: outer membrane protein assembly factor BamA [Gammaproteobacteria bacterium]|nr:MAG: outer membrane protein assembly factor BamA [Gammaproteobacteria bacterium]
MTKYIGRLWILAILFAHNVWAFQPFQVKAIDYEGLQHIDPENLENYQVIRPDQQVDNQLVIQQIHALYRSGYFDDIQIKRQDDRLVIAVKERKLIAGVEITGNKAIKEESIKEAFNAVGIKEGEFFDPLSLAKMNQELHALYASHSKYNARVSMNTVEEDEAHLIVKVDIEEGKSSKIREINIVGNHVFTDKTLLGKFKLDTGGLFSFFNHNNEFSRQRLSADLESLRSFYMDQGYADFSIDSVQVTISPEREAINITINLTEGDQYRIGKIDYRSSSQEFGDDAFRESLGIEEGQVFSRKSILDSSEKMRIQLGNKGFLNAKVNAIPNLDKREHVSDILFDIDPGKRVYVNEIRFRGNTKTRDDVLRREMRQMEGSWIETDKVKRSRVRLQRLDYFKKVDVDVVPVPEHDDLVDLDFSVEEKPSAAFVGGFGFSQAQGFLVNASVKQKNFLGSGNTVGLNINNSNVNTVYSASYTNPYYTLDGVSRGFNLFARQTDAGAVSVADFSSDNFGGTLSYGIPVSEYSTASISFGLEHQSLTETDSTPQEFIDFIRANRSDFDLYKITAGISYDTRNRVVFAEDGVLLSASEELALPGSGLTFYKINLRGQWLKTYIEPFTLSLKTNLGYGASYSDTTELPFFESYFAGGAQSVRGYKSNSLGPRTALDNSPMGGAMKVVANAEVIFPPPFSEDNRSVRFALFFDIGNIYANINKFDLGELRYTTGVSLVWLSPLGPLSFSLASALNEKQGDETESFQFSLGTLF